MQANSRITMVDALRGYALLGLFMVHCVERFELHWLEPKPGFWFDAVFALFSGKAAAVASWMFGPSLRPIKSPGPKLTVPFTLMAMSTYERAVPRP